MPDVMLLQLHPKQVHITTRGCRKGQWPQEQAKESRPPHATCLWMKLYASQHTGLQADPSTHPPVSMATFASSTAFTCTPCGRHSCKAQSRKHTNSTVQMSKGDHCTHIDHDIAQTCMLAHYQTPCQKYEDEPRRHLSTVTTGHDIMNGKLRSHQQLHQPPAVAPAHLWGDLASPDRCNLAS